ncbi:tRNA threonylcarbamoyladenosine dehydratase [Moraxella nasovis]|uniref:tRNA threonylcarbamoyladenosine dehydratase n=1 Tax=Moraxella nasovis TaxID=2904121 RepID=UPI001F604D6F|nr:tRNA threonylcarbamoyladenosine dehydratase [Moraxella nasovis]UNU72820.1 tRNA threonylcarbamoyladenosine dehydratase [Moraxella nasovis]
MLQNQQDSRRFMGTRTLYGDDFYGFNKAHVFIIGIGGVGSWAAEALARTGIGMMTLVDLDVLAESNVNRQLPALTETLGDGKADVMAQRILSINPDATVNIVDDFLTVNNVSDILPDKQTVDLLKQQGITPIVLDCTDDMGAKLAIALHCRFNKIGLVISGGAGGKLDPLQIKVDDLKYVSQDPLLARLRSKLREKGINKALKEKFGLKCVYSTEQLKMATACESGLNCGGYGSAVVVTSTVGMVMASECLSLIAKSTKSIER